MVRLAFSLWLSCTDRVQFYTLCLLSLFLTSFAIFKLCRTVYLPAPLPYLNNNSITIVQMHTVTMSEAEHRAYQSWKAQVNAEGKSSLRGRKDDSRKKGQKSLTRKGDKDYTTKKGDRDYHRNHHVIKERIDPYETLR